MGHKYDTNSENRKKSQGYFKLAVFPVGNESTNNGPYYSASCRLTRAILVVYLDTLILQTIPRDG